MQPTRITSVELCAKLGATIDSTLIDRLIVAKHGHDHLVNPSAECDATVVAAEADLTCKPVSPAAKLARTC